MKKLFIATLTIASMAVSVCAQNLLTNGDFEDGANGWTELFNGAAVNSDYVRSGASSLMLEGTGAWSVPGAYVSLPANPGDVFNFQGYLGVDTQLVDPGALMVGLFKIVWSDGSSDLDPLVPDTALIGTPLTGTDPGIEATPLVDPSTPGSSWVFAEAQGTAPAGTTSVSFFALFVNGGVGTIYADDLVVTVVPEPQTYAAILGLLTLAFVAYRRRK